MTPVSDGDTLRCAGLRCRSGAKSSVKRRQRQPPAAASQRHQPLPCIGNKRSLQPNGSGSEAPEPPHAAAADTVNAGGLNPATVAPAREEQRQFAHRHATQSSYSPVAPSAVRRPPAAASQNTFTMSVTPRSEVRCSHVGKSPRLPARIWLFFDILYSRRVMLHISEAVL